MTPEQIAAWLAAATGLAAFLTASVGAWKSARNATAIHSLEVKVDGRLTELLDQTRLVSEEAQKVARLLGREEMRSETDIVARDLAATAIEATLQATKDTPVSVDVVSSVPVELKTP